MEELKLKTPQKIYFWHLTDFMSVVKPFNKFARLFGLCAIEMFETKTKFDYLAKATRRIILIGWLVFFVYFGRVNYDINYFSSLSNNEIANTGRRYMFFFGMFLSVIGIISTHLVKRSIFNFMHGLLRFDHGLERIGHIIDLKFEAWFYVAHIIYQISSSVVIVVITAIYYDQTEDYMVFVHMYIPMYICNTMYIVCSSRFIAYCFSATHRFKTLNKSFDKFLKIKREHKFEFKKFEGVDLRYNSVLDYAKLHETLTNSVIDLNQTYSFQLMIMFGGTFCYIITTLFTLFRTVFYQDNRLISLTGSFTLWCIFYSIPIIMVIFIGSSVKNNVIFLINFQK